MNRRYVVLLPVFALLLLSWAAPTAHAEFGVAPGTLNAVAEEEGGALDLRAGSHPFAYTVHFELNTDSLGVAEGGQMRDLLIEVPTGLVGNPRAVPSCTLQTLEAGKAGCPNSTQVGVLVATNSKLGQFGTPIYNIAPPPGAAVEFGVNAKTQEFLGQQFGSVRLENAQGQAEYGVNVFTPALPIEITSVTASIWGTPADPGHTPERGPDSSGGGFPSEAPLLPFLTLPASCSAPPQITVAIDSSLNPGSYVRDTAPMKDGAGSAVGLNGCSSVPFNPDIASRPSTTQAESAAGLSFKLNLPNEGLLTPNGIAETQPEKTEVLLPRGVTVNPSAAGGLVGCTLAQFKAANGEPGVGCPEASKVGTLVAKTPVLEEAIEGAVYLAQPHENKFDSLLGLYIVAKAGERGVLVKQAGKVEADESTGQLTTTFDELPPLPYSAFEFDLREGPRAPLITPQACGEYTTTARLYPFSDPDAATVRTAPFEVAAGASGASCISSEAQMPAHPNFEAGSATPLGGTYSPFIFKLARSDGEQRFSAVVAEPPLGLTAKLAEIPYCPQSGIGQAGSRTGEGDGALEEASPSCPAASQVGTVTASAGAGSSPYFTGGKVYLAGPYKGAPLSLEAIAPAVAGPFDLGVVANRIALYVNEETAKITAKSDPLPSILHGIPLDLRSVSVQLDRKQFSLNPTNCEPTTVNGSLTTLTGAVAPLSGHFGLGGCKGLKFEPKLRLQLSGATKRAGHPALKAEISFPHSEEEAHTKSIQVGLPHSLFLDQGNLNKVCKQADLHAGTCPKGSVYGHVKAWTPLLENPLQGPVYLGVGFGYKLPALVTDLNGQIRILAHGRTDTTKQNGLRNTFEFVPDAPLNRVVLQLKGGKKYGLIENSENLCAKMQTANARLVAHNGQVAQLHPAIASDCRKSAGKHKKSSGTH